jgi:hypothetical protein
MCLLILGEDASNRRDISGVMPYAEQALAAGPHNKRPAVADGRGAVVARDGALAENLIRSGHAACRYSWRVPPRRSRWRMLRRAICTGSVIGDRCGEWVQWVGVGDALMRSVGVVEAFVLPEGVEQVALVPDQGAV